MFLMQSSHEASEDKSSVEEEDMGPMPVRGSANF